LFQLLSIADFCCGYRTIRQFGMVTATLASLLASTALFANFVLVTAAVSILASVTAEDANLHYNRTIC
jgi:hypothetical protein